MGKYVANINMGGHRRGEVKEYDEGDPVLARRLKAGTVKPVDGNPRPVVETSASDPEPVVEGSEDQQPVDNSVDNAEDDEAKPAPAKKRAAAKKKVDPEPVVEDEPVAEEPAEEQSSVQTSWYISPAQSEG